MQLPQGTPAAYVSRPISSTSGVLTPRAVTIPEEAAVMEVYNGRNTVCMRDTDR